MFGQTEPFTQFVLLYTKKMHSIARQYPYIVFLCIKNYQMERGLCVNEFFDSIYKATLKSRVLVTLVQVKLWILEKRVFSFIIEFQSLIFR